MIKDKDEVTQVKNEVTQVKNVPKYSLILNKEALLSPPNSEYDAGNLFLGGYRAITSQFISTHSITAVLTVMDLKSYKKLNLASQVEQIDGIENHLFIQTLDNAQAQIFQYFPQTNAFIDAALNKENGSVFVHCKGGYSRSPAILAAYLIWKTGKSFQEIEKFIKSRRECIDINAGFKAQLLKYADQVKK